MSEEIESLTSDVFIVGYSEHSKACRERRWSDGATDYVCTWPGCSFSADTVPSMGSHFKRHTGKAAQRRRGERSNQVGSVEDVTRTLYAAMDAISDAIDYIASIGAEMDEHHNAKEQLDALRQLLK